MAIYVDNAFIRFGRMDMCHLMSDESEEELRLFADRIGLKQEWIQKPGTSKVHFDVSKGSRLKAIAQGAIPVTATQLVRICILDKRKAKA